MIRKYAEIFCWKKIAKATHIFSAKNIRILCIESAKTVNEMTLNVLIKLTKLWTTGPRSLLVAKSCQNWTKLYIPEVYISTHLMLLQVIFITEYMSSGSLKQFLMKTKKNNKTFQLKVSARGDSGKDASNQGYCCPVDQLYLIISRTGLLWLMIRKNFHSGLIGNSR